MKKLLVIIILFLGCSKEDNSELIAQYEQQVSNLSTQITDLNNQVSDLTNQLSNIQTENNDLTSTNNSLNEEVETQSSEISELQNSNTEIQSLYEEIQSLYAAIEEEYNSLVESNSNVSIVSLSTQNSLLLEQISALQAELEILNEVIIGLQLELLISQVETTPATTISSETETSTSSGTTASSGTETSTSSESTSSGTTASSETETTASSETETSTNYALEGNFSDAVNFLAVGYNGTILTSENGETWTSRSNSNVIGSLFGATYGNGVFVITGNDGTYTSSDGISWTRTGEGSRKVLYSNGKFVGGPGYSTDGTNWSSGCSGWGIAYGDGKYVYVPYSYGDHTYSTDGVNCQSSNKIPNSYLAENSGYLWDLAYGNGMFVAAAGNGNSFYVTSPDGINWTPRTFSRSGHRMSTISYVNGKFVGVGGGGSISVSSDGINWTESQVSSDPNKNGTLQSVTYGNGKYVIGGSIRVSSSEFYDGVYISSDLQNWTSYNLGASGELGLYYMIYKN